MFLSDGYKLYLKHIYAEMQILVSKLMNDEISAEYFKGACDLFYKIVKMPEKVVDKTDPKHKEIIDRLNKIMELSIEEFEVSVIKKIMFGEIK